MDKLRVAVKVGGSLFDWPELRTRLRTFLSNLDAAQVILIPGGGPTADAIRGLDVTHQLGAEASHWLAIEALSLNARFLRQILPEANSDGRWSVLDALPFFRDDEQRPDHLPHDWHVTSDSLAARAAILCNADELILLKSVAWLGDDWAEAARAGLVDAYFPQASRGLRVRVINLRAEP